MSTTPTAQRFIEELEAYRSPEQREKYQRYFKTGKGQYGEGDEFIGVRMGQIFALAKEFIEMLPGEIEELLESPVHEYGQGRSIMDKQGRSNKTPESRRKELFDLYLRSAERSTIGTWSTSARRTWSAATCSTSRATFCGLARSSVWERRTAIVSTSYFIRQGDVNDTFEIAEILLGDDHDLIHKATGGWLREAGKEGSSTTTALPGRVRRHYATHDAALRNRTPRWGTAGPLPEPETSH